MTEAGDSSGKRVSNDSQEFVTLTIADQMFGIPVNEIHDVFSPQQITRVPLAAPEIAGVLNLRGRIVTVVDARIKLGLPPREEDASCMAVGIERRGESYGILIDSVGEVLRLTYEHYEANPVNLDARWQGVSRGVYRLDKNLLVVLNVDKIIEQGGAVAA